MWFSLCAERLSELTHSKSYTPLKRLVFHAINVGKNSSIECV